MAAVLALSLAAALLSETAAAQSASDLGAKADGAREKAQALEGQIEQRGGELSEQQGAAATAAARGAELEQRVSAGRDRIAELEAELEQARVELQEARRRLERASTRLSKRLVAIYKHGQPDELDVLLSSDGYDQLAGTAGYLVRIKDADDALIADARARRADLDERAETVASTRNRQQELNDELAAASAEIAAVRAEAEQRAATIAAAIDSSRSQAGALRNQADRFDKKARQAAEAAEAAQAAEATPAQPSYDAPKNGWAIPESIVMCESGGNWSALNPVSGAGGAYQILPSTWKLYGGKGLPHEASPAEQSRIAAMIWADSGPAAWVCA